MILKTKLLGHVYEFKSVKDALAKANEEKSGDRLAGIAAEILSYYFSTGTTMESVDGENQLLH